MNNQLSISTAEFERQKNVKASVYTACITILIFLIFIWVKMTIPKQEEPLVEEFMEVNLGSGDQGFGTDQPLLPGDPAPAMQASYTPPQAVQSREESVRDISSEDNSPQAPTVIKPAVSSPTATKTNAESKSVKPSNNTTQPVVTQAPPQPRAVLGRTTGGNGNGGNGADTYKSGGNEGVAGGTGDQGRAGGDPNGRNYSGTPKNFGVQVLNIPNQSFEDDFNRDAKVAMDIMVDAGGKVTSATYQPRGSNTSDRKYLDIARRSAFQLKTFGASSGGQKGTVVFNFKVKG